jgi:hypothetical protein
MVFEEVMEAKKQRLDELLLIEGRRKNLNNRGCRLIEPDMIWKTGR